MFLHFIYVYCVRQRSICQRLSGLMLLLAAHLNLIEVKCLILVLLEMLNFLWAPTDSH